MLEHSTRDFVRRQILLAPQCRWLCKNSLLHQSHCSSLYSNKILMQNIDGVAGPKDAVSQKLI